MKKILLLFIPFVLSGCFSDPPEVRSFDEQLAIDLAIIDEYLMENDIQADIHESGIRFVTTQDGSGATPAENDRFVAKYRGEILSGNEFAKSQYGSTFTLNANLIPAWQIMMQEMQVDQKITVYAPSGYCFGSNANNIIPANSNMIFDIELVRLIESEEEQFTADTTIINEYLEGNELEAEVHASGIRYLVLNEGDGASPTVSDTVEVKYTGYFTNDEVFDSNEDGFSFELDRLIEAWRIILPEMKEGERRTIFSPSKYGYGTAGSSSILPNTVLIFDIELVEVNPD